MDTHGNKKYPIDATHYCHKRVDGIGVGDATDGCNIDMIALPK
jgi:hypothetical protein